MKEELGNTCSIEDQLASAHKTIDRLINEAFDKKKELRERIFLDRSARSRGHYGDAMQETAEVVAFILGEDAPAPPREGLLGVQQQNAANRIVEMDNCHKYLDTMGILREGSPGNPFSLEGRIKLLAHLRNEPRMPMIPLEDLHKWVEDELADAVIPAGSMDKHVYHTDGYRECLAKIANRFGIPERNAVAIWPKTTESVLNSEDLARIVKVIDGRKDGHWELRDGGPVYVIDKPQNSGGGEGSNLEPTA